MKLTCTQKNLAQNLSLVSHIASRHANLPILGNVLIRIEDKLIKFVATNLEIAVTATVRGKIEGEGSFTIPAKLFADYTASLLSERVELEQSGDVLEIRGGNSRTKIKGQPASEFPLIPEVRQEGAARYRIPVADFKRANARVLFAASSNESRPELSGVLFRFEPDGPAGRLIMAATDSYRLAESVVSLHEVPAGFGGRSIIVPARTLGELGRIIGAVAKDEADMPATIEVVVTDNQILFVYGTIELVSRLIEGRYPDYQSVIGGTHRTTVTAERDALLRAVKTASLFSHSGLFDVHVKIKKSGALIISASDSQTGENETELSATVSGEENQVVLNHRYLVEGLTAIDASEVSLRVVDGVNPCLLVPKEQTPGSNYLYVIMPIKQ